jgi:hypothetical protein
MSLGQSFVQYWYFHVPNYLLAVMLYATIGRFLLGLMVDENWSNYIWRGFKAVSQPAVWLARRLTPEAVPLPLVLVFTMIWLMAARVALFIGFASIGLLPRVQA